jgi:hypothetical protein
VGRVGAEAGELAIGDGFADGTGSPTNGSTKPIDSTATRSAWAWKKIRNARSGRGAQRWRSSR